MAEEQMAPWQRATEQKYQKQEKRTAKNQGGRRQPNSGRLWHSLRDVVLTNPVAKLLVDNKGTESGSYRITEDDWNKLRRDSNRTPPGCLPALQIDIRDTHLMVVDLATWDEIIKYIASLETELEYARKETPDA